MTKTSVSPKFSLDFRSQRREADKLLSAGRYDRVAALLRDCQAAGEQQGDARLVQIITATRRLCLACRQFHRETERHRQAYFETRECEQALQRDLQAILDSLAGLEQTAAGGASPVETTPCDEIVPLSVRAGALVRNIQTLLRQGPDLRTRPPASSAVADHGTAEPGLAEMGRPPSASQPPRACRSERPRAPEVEGARAGQGPPALVVYCLGPFQVYHGDQPIEDWPNGKGKLIFKYLVTHRDRPIGKEVLMDLFWPNAEAPAARNNLNVAIYGLRHAISKVNPCQSHVLFQNDCYLLNPDLSIWTDYEDFTRNIAKARSLERSGKETLAVQHYRTAEALYQGEFLEEDRYEDWLMPLRQQLQDEYLALLDRLYRHYFDQQSYDACTMRCRKMLAIDRCHERAHRRLMRCYSKQGQPYLALRQFQSCKTALARELDVVPSKPTLELYEKIRHQQPV